MENTRHVKTQIESTTQEIKHLICNETKNFEFFLSQHFPYDWKYF